MTLFERVVIPISKITVEKEAKNLIHNTPKKIISAGCKIKITKWYIGFNVSKVYDLFGKHMPFARNILQMIEVNLKLPKEKGDFNTYWYCGLDGKWKRLFEI